MTGKITPLLILTILVWQGACVHKKSPKIGKKVRPPNTPTSAILIDGFEYGFWVDCTIKNEKQGRYFCRAYDDREGLLTMSGEFVLREKEGKNDNSISKTPLPELIYSSFGGVVEGLENRSRLVPDGIIDYPRGRNYPEGDGRGMKQVYRLGQMIGEERYY